MHTKFQFRNKKQLKKEITFMDISILNLLIVNYPMLKLDLLKINSKINKYGYSEIFRNYKRT